MLGHRDRIRDPKPILKLGGQAALIGDVRLAGLARLSETTARRSVRSLARKLAVEEIAAHKSAERIGKPYLIFSYPAILARRNAAGLKWVLRSKAVRFVNSDGSEPPLAKCSTDSVVVPAMAHLPASVAATAAQAAARQIVAACRAADSGATVDEISWLAAMKDQAGRRDDLTKFAWAADYRTPQVLRPARNRVVAVPRGKDP